MTIKTSLCLALLCLFLAACSRPKSDVIPPDPKKWGDLTDDVQRLGLEDRQLISAYLIRMGSATATGTDAVPNGFTIGQAIDEERDFEEKNRVEEAQADTEKARADAANAKAKATEAAAIAKMQGLITFSAVSITILPKKIEVQRYSPQLSVPFTIKNNTQKDIAGVKGTIVLLDVFGAPLQNLEISTDKSIPAGQEITLPSYVWELNEFDDADKHLLTVDLTKVKAIFQPSMIVFTDGSKVAAPDASSPDSTPP